MVRTWSLPGRTHVEVRIEQIIKGSLTLCSVFESAQPMPLSRWHGTARRGREINAAHDTTSVLLSLEFRGWFLSMSIYTNFRVRVRVRVTVRPDLEIDWSCLNY